MLTTPAHHIYRILTAQAGAPIWTEHELARAIDHAEEEIRDALSELFIAGLIRPLVHREGWRRA